MIRKELYEERTNRSQRSQFFSELIFKKHISRTEDGYILWIFFLLFIPNVILFRRYKRGIQLDILQVILGGCNVSDSETLSR